MGVYGYRLAMVVYMGSGNRNVCLSILSLRDYQNQNSVA